MLVEERTTTAVCNKCGSDAVGCSYEYYTTGGDMEHVEFKHACGACGYVESKIQQGCYGYDNSCQCSMRHKDSN